MKEFTFEDNEHLMYPNILGMDDQMPAFIKFKFYKRVNMRNSVEVQTICLPMPTGLKKPSTISYDNTSLGFAVNNAVNSVRSGESSNLASALVTANANTTSAMTAGEHTLYKMMSVGTQTLRSQATADNLMGLSAGKVGNPYYTMIFKGVNLGQYEFEFIFTPNNPEEAVTINKIIKSFRMHSSPHRDDVGEHFLGFPNEVEVTFWWKGEENEWIRKFKRSVISFIDGDDAPLGTTTLARGGVNVQQILRLKLTETEIITRRDIQRGY